MTVGLPLLGAGCALACLARLLGASEEALRQACSEAARLREEPYDGAFYFSKELSFYLRSKPVIEDFIARWLPRTSGAVLDLGCGAGFYTRALEQRAGAYLGLDLSASGPRLARLLFPDPGLGFVRADATRLPLAGASVDHAFSTEVIEHIPAASAVFEEAYRVLKPGGCLLLTTTTFGYYFIDLLTRWAWRDLAERRNPRRFLRRLRLYCAGYRGPGQRSRFMLEALERTDHCHAFTLRHLRRLARQAGFEVVRHVYFTAKDLIPGRRFALVRVANRFLRFAFRTSRWFGPNLALLCRKPHLRPA